MQGGGSAPDMPGVGFDAKEIVYGLLLSKYGDAQQVTEMFQQNWVQEWHGWIELSETATDAEYMRAATRFERLAQENRPAQLKTNAARLEELAEAGLTLIDASPHGVNNCLIDSLLLGLVAVGVLGVPVDIDMRRQVCAACRSYLITEHNVGKATYLDAHRDVPRILHYFFQIAGPKPVALTINLYDRFEQEELGAEVQGQLQVIEYLTERGACPWYELHIFNHASENGAGYHFDLLWPTGKAMVRCATPAIPPLAPKMQELAKAGSHMTPVRHVLSTRPQAEHVDSAWVDDARALLRRVFDEASTEPPTDATTLELWKDAGYVVDRTVGEALRHSLIRALWKSLCACAVLPCDQGPGREEAGDIMNQCMAAVVEPNVINPSMNWWRDSIAIVQWLLNHAGATPKHNVRLQCADRHKLEEIAPSISSLEIYSGAAAPSEATTLRIYAYSTFTGQEWRYDALIPKPEETEASADAESRSLDQAARAVRPRPSADSGVMPENTDLRRACVDARAGNEASNCRPKTEEEVGDAAHRLQGAGGADLKTCLQNFLAARTQTPICVCEADVAALCAQWQNLAAVGALLQTWLGASMPAFEPTRKSAHVLAKAWMRYYIACTQGKKTRARKEHAPQRQRGERQSPRLLSKTDRRRQRATPNVRRQPGNEVRRRNGIEKKLRKKNQSLQTLS